ncbi:ParA family protein [Mycobacterium hodleri]|uniref:ParA family protein n=1 Tax=Mycolicibacterium hodleri TaxID=49897 RepID=UPI0021F2D67F|nr:ParA family protein [Mycolicibacterium hodleri]MCV7137479.1 ParA family protein [Mycolicibacterium hodleri]
MAATVIAICNQKGGVGKTTTTFHLADALRRADSKVLCVDLDPQGNLTSILVREALEHDDTGVADALSGFTSRSLPEVITEGLWAGVDIAPTAPMNPDPSAAPVDRLASVRDELVVAGTGRERRLKEGLAPLINDYDIVLIDCAPSLDLLTINALVAATDAIELSEAALFSANGLAKLGKNIAGIRDSYNPHLRGPRVIVNKYESQTISGREALADIGTYIPIIGTPIPKAVVIKDAAEARTSLLDWGTTTARNLFAFYRDIAVQLLEVEHAAPTAP